MILAIITRTTSRTMAESTQLLIDVATPIGKSSGLLHTSAIKCEILMTFTSRLFDELWDTYPRHCSCKSMDA